jgi:RecB family exonuclease
VFDLSILLGTKRKDLPSIHNSDRMEFLRCRRRWDWHSFLRQGLEPTGEQAKALWFGSGFHFALEDFHGYNRFPNPAHALRAYAKAFNEGVKPGEWRELVKTGEEMLDYYANAWLPQHRTFETYWVNGIPQCEVEFDIKIPGIAATYGGTFDRIVVDADGRLWVLDWKTAGKFDSKKWETDPQVSAYTWAAQQIYGRTFEGVVMVQFLKSPPKTPKVLKNGELSRDKSQPTNYELYHAAVLERFGEIPELYVEFLNHLAKLDGFHR